MTFVLFPTPRRRISSASPAGTGDASTCHARIRRVAVVGLALGVVLAASCSSPAPSVTSPSLGRVKQELDGLPFTAFVETSFDLYMLRYPQTVASLGLTSALGVRDDRLDDASSAYERESADIAAAIVARLRAFSRSSLSADERVMYDVCEWMWSGGAARRGLVWSYAIFPGEEGPDARLARFFIEDVAVDSPQAADDYVACLHAVERQVDQVRRRFAEQTRRGIVLPDSALQLTLLQLDALRAASTATKSEWLPPHNVGTHHPLFVPLRDALPRIAALPRDERAKMTTTVGRYVAERVMPALERLYQDAARLAARAPAAPLGWSAAGGRASPEELFRQASGTALSPLDVSRRARAEMARLRPEIASLAVRIGLAASTPLPDVEAAAAAQFDADAARAGFPASAYGAVMAQACGTLLPSRARLTAREVGTDTGSLLFSDTAPWSCSLPDPFAGFLSGLRLHLLRRAETTGTADAFPALAITIRAELYRAAALAALDAGIHAMGWTQEQAQRELASMLETTTGGPSVRVVRSGKRATATTFQATDNLSFADVARVAGSPGQGAAAFAAYSEIERLREESAARAGAAWSESAFLGALVAHGAVPLVVAQKLIDDAFPRR